MSERATGEERGESLDQSRLLTEVDHLMRGRLPDGSIDPAVLRDVSVNLYTAVHEIAMPYAVTTTEHVAEEIVTEGRRRRIFRWLGKSAVEVATSGYSYHFSPEAYRRVDLEVAEARRNQEQASPDTVQVFISPKMSVYDAPIDVAKREHFYCDDAIRTSRIITDEQGNVTGRQLQSLLVRDVPLEAWVAMLEDPNNIFGKAIPVAEKRSALSVMELFEHLDVPASALPEGVVTLVDAVRPYISSAEARASVADQLQRFRGDQDMYRTQAQQTAERWLQFEIELARSLHSGQATRAIAGFVASLQHQWSADKLQLLQRHDTGDGGYRMTRELAACLEKAQQNVLNGEAAIATGNDKVLEQMSYRDRRRIQERMDFIGILQASGASMQQIDLQRAELRRDIARQNIAVGGGCPGKNADNFGGDDSDPRIGAAETSADQKDWKWKSGVCKVKSCPSPKPTEVGPCSVCRSCQHIFDSGGDPTKTPPRPKKVPIPQKVLALA